MTTLCHATHGLRGNENFNSLYLFYAAFRSSLCTLYYTQLVGHNYVDHVDHCTVYLCQHFEHSFFPIVIKNNYAYMTIWFVISIYLQYFLLFNKLVVVKKVLQVLNDSGQEIDTMHIENLVVLPEKKRVDGIILFKINKMTGN